MITTRLRLKNDYELDTATPQIRRWWFPVWQDFTDFDYPDVPGEYDPSYEPHSKGYDLLSSALGKIAFYKGWQYEGSGTFEPVSMRSKIQKFFMGVPGMQGAMGAMGMPGRQGERGRAASDCQCPHCLVWRSDSQKPQLFLEVLGGNLYMYKCPNCNTKSKWRILDGLMIHADKVKAYELHSKHRTKRRS